MSKNPIEGSVFKVEASGQSRRSVDRSKFHLGDNASVAKIALNDRPSSSGQASSHFRESKRGRQGGGQSAFGHFELVPSRPGRASGVRHSSTSVDAAPPSPQEVRVEWGRNLLGREGESFQVVSRSFFDYSILYTLRYGERREGEGGAT